MYKVLLDQAKKSLPLFGVLAGVGGFIADILQPIAPFSSYVFYISIGLAFVIGVLIYIAVGLRETLAPYLIFVLLTGLSSGALFGLQNEESEQKGVFASNMSWADSLQEALGLIQKDIQDIKEATVAIQKSSAETAKNTEIIADSISEMQKYFSRTVQSGGVIANPERPEQFYHNARVYETRGDYGNASVSYHRYFSFGLDILDPHLRYQRFLKVQEGRAGALETYSDMYREDKHMIIEFSRVLLFEPRTRLQLLETFSEKYPNFAPVFYEISRDYSFSRKGIQSLDDKVNERASLETFLRLNEEGNFLKYFLDNDLATNWLEDAKERLLSLKTLSHVQPLKLNEVYRNVFLKDGRQQGDKGWEINVSIYDIVVELFYKTNKDENYISTGFTKEIDSRTGRERPVGRFKLEQINPDIFIKYLDLNGKEIGPFTFNLDAEKNIIERAKKRLEENDTASWVSLRSWTRTINSMDYPEKVELQEKVDEAFENFLKCNGKKMNLSYRRADDEECKVDWGEKREEYQDMMFELPSWKEIGKEPKLTLNFPGVESNECALSEIKYGIAQDVPDKTLDFKECDKYVSRHHADFPQPGDIPVDTEFVTVQLTYKDGTKTDIKRFENDG